MQEKQTFKDLQEQWANAWGMFPHKGIGRAMLEKSLKFKVLNKLNDNHKKQLDVLIKRYKRNSKSFEDNATTLKVGTQLIRNWKGVRHTVIVKTQGFEYQEKDYKSLSRIANEITGTRWNGYVFFGLKKKGVS